MEFHVTIKNNEGKEVSVKVSFEVYNIFEDERKEKERLHKEYERHGDDTEVDSDIVAFRYNLHKTSIEDKVACRSELQQAMQIIKMCTQTQQRRFHLYRILGYSLTEIAKMEDCSKNRVKKSVDVVSEKIKKLFLN